jgi:nicotinamide mononucleotide transporter
MTWNSVLSYLTTNWLELIGAIIAAIGIWLTTLRRMLCWPVVLISILIYTVVFYRTGLYSDAMLQLFFLAFTIYGWWHWWHGKREEGEVRVVPLPRSQMARALLLGFIGSFLIGSLTKRLNAALPYMDATLMSYSLVASWWGARKHIANWWLWIIIDVAYVGEYLYKSLWPTAILYGVIFVPLAVFGLIEWRRAPAAAQIAA